MTGRFEEAAFQDSASLGASSAVAASRWVVMKFGGSGMASPARWATLLQLVTKRADAGLRPVVVVSALKGVTNLLEQIIDAAANRYPEQEVAVLRQHHLDAAHDLGLDDPQLLAEPFADLERLLQAALAADTISPAERARVVACGELLASRICATYLRSNGVTAHHEDARDILQSRAFDGRNETQNYFSAECGYDYDADLDARLGNVAGVILTEGYIAANPQGETVLLGREGSDTSAAYIAAKLRARRLEIWTDVPGLFSADPQLVPSARLLVALSYDEAQELSSSGSRALHPRCIAPLRSDGIPLFVRCTALPHLTGTTVSAATRSALPQVKGIAVRSGITLISMQAESMWQEVGFLARAFSIFASHRISVDLVSTSQSSVVVSVDATEGYFSDAEWADLIGDLEKLCDVTIIEQCAVISLIGRRIRATISALGPAFALFAEEKIHLISQAANDLNFSFAIDQNVVPKILGDFHAAVIGDSHDRDVFGPGWQNLARGEAGPGSKAVPWWKTKRQQLLELAHEHTHAYVYDSEHLRDTARSVTGMRSIDRCLYAMKANFNADILRLLADEGVDFDCVSPEEVLHLRKAVPDLAVERILLTLNFAPRSEYEWALGEGLQITLDNLHPLQAWPELFDGQKLFVRFDPGVGRGHHEHVKTAGKLSKFGIPIAEAGELADLVAAANATVVGVHAHSGSGIKDPDNWRGVAEELVTVASLFPEVTVLDLGGGLGIPEKSDEAEFDLAALDELLIEFRDSNPDYRLWLEPGRYLVARAGVLLARVTQTKGKGEIRYVGVSTGMNSLLRPALYGAYHEIFNLSRIDEPAIMLANVVGPICESGDKLGSERLLPECREGDVILVADSGAYGHAMGSRYNLREAASEIVLT
jgi:diaminopimelate decarboxylase/aspartate kinase